MSITAKSDAVAEGSLSLKEIKTLLEGDSLSRLAYGKERMSDERWGLYAPQDRRWVAIASHSYRPGGEHGYTIHHITGDLENDLQVDIDTQELRRRLKESFDPEVFDSTAKKTAEDIERRINHPEFLNLVVEVTSDWHSSDIEGGTKIMPHAMALEVEVGETTWRDSFEFVFKYTEINSAESKSKAIDAILSASSGADEVLRFRIVP